MYCFSKLHPFYNKSHTTFCMNFWYRYFNLLLLLLGANCLVLQWQYLCGICRAYNEFLVSKQCCIVLWQEFNTETLMTVHTHDLTQYMIPTKRAQRANQLPVTYFRPFSLPYFRYVLKIVTIFKNKSMYLVIDCWFLL